MPPHSTSLNTLLRPSRTSHGTSAILTHTDTSRHPTPLDFSWVHALHPSPSTAQRKTSDPQPISLKAAHGTFGLGVVHCKHVDCHELEHAGASDGRGAVLQQDLELPQDLLGHRRERLHPADRERCWRAERRLCPGKGGTAPSVSPCPGNRDPPQGAEGLLPIPEPQGIAASGVKVQAVRGRQPKPSSARDCSVTNRQHSFGRKTRPL